MKKLLLVSLCLLVLAASASAQPGAPRKSLESYSAFIYTSDDLADEVDRVVAESRSRGLFEDMLGAGVAAVKGIGAGYVTTFIDMGVSAIGQLLTKDARDKQAWEETVKKENSFSMTIKTISEISDFYDDVSFDGPMDPSGMKFNGIGCIKKQGDDTTFFVSCHINRDKIHRIVNHSKFELVLDTLIVSPYHSDLPNTRLDIPFSFDERDNFSLTLAMQLTSSWMDQLPQMNKDQVLGDFLITVPVRKEELGPDGYLKYVRANGEAPRYAVVGESFIVPRSYMSVRSADGKMKYSWGTGEYKLAVTLSEKCDATKQYQENWKKDFKRRKAMEPQKTMWENFVQLVTTQKWDEITKSWIVTTLKAPADVLSKEIISDLELGAPVAASGGAGAAAGKAGSASGSGGPAPGGPAPGDAPSGDKK
ncbi:MAG: hypothetical protein K6A62_03930 [Bacteroidales bacterium]|nr:hypothetical protein [Bacteroidales bacterium]